MRAGGEVWAIEVGDRVTDREDTGASDEAAVCCMCFRVLCACICVCI